VLSVVSDFLHNVGSYIDEPSESCRRLGRLVSTCGERERGSRRGESSGNDHHWNILLGGKRGVEQGLRDIPTYPTGGMDSGDEG
jgi:hypothetical protein